MRALAEVAAHQVGVAAARERGVEGVAVPGEGHAPEVEVDRPERPRRPGVTSKSSRSAIFRPRAMSTIVVAGGERPRVGVGVAGHERRHGAERPSGEIRARLGTPGSLSSRRGVRSSPRMRTLTDAPSAPARERQSPRPAAK